MVLLLAVVCGAASRPEERSVQVRKADLRPEPSYLSKPTGSLAYGDRVAVLESRSGWYRVSPTGATPGAWVHGSALTTKTIVLKTGSAATTVASSDELALAGKGFNADVEAQFKAGHKNIDFAWVDRMEKARVPPEKCQAFLREGGLRAVAGGEGAP